jgi:hypothetical protein
VSARYLRLERIPCTIWGMPTFRVSNEYMGDVERALEEYRDLLAGLKRKGLLKENTRKTYMLHSENFVRWLRREFDPGERNRA